MPAVSTPPVAITLIQVRAVRDLPSDDVAHLVLAARLAAPEPAVALRRRDRLTRAQEPRSGNIEARDPVAQLELAVRAAAEIARGGDAGLDHRARARDHAREQHVGRDRELLRGRADLGVERQVHVRVDQTRQRGRAVERDRLAIRIGIEVRDRAPGSARRRCAASRARDRARRSCRPRSRAPSAQATRGHAITVRRVDRRGAARSRRRARADGRVRGAARRDARLRARALGVLPAAEVPGGRAVRERVRDRLDLLAHLVRERGAGRVRRRVDRSARTAGVRVRRRGAA